MNHSYIKTVLLLCFLLFASGEAFGQDEFLGLFNSGPRGQVSWIHTRPNFYDTKLTEAQKQMLAPLPEDLLAHAAFLKQENTGIFRLHPRGKYEMSRTISANPAAEMVLPILGGGAYYSFAEKTNKLGPWSEICLNNNLLSANGTGKTIGILTSLGDVALADVTLTTQGLDYLTKLSPPKTFTEVVELSAKSSRGFIANEQRYSSVLGAALNTTYVLRSILYKKDGYVVHPNEPYYRLRLSSLGYDGSDQIVAFRIIRRHEDNSITILWRRLQKFAASKLKGNFAKYNYEEITQLLEQKLAKGVSLAQVNSFLDAHAIERTPSVEASKDEASVEGTKEFVYAIVPQIERKGRAVFDLYIRFSFNDKKELLDWTFKKGRR